MVRIYEQNLSALHYDIWCKIGTFALNLLGT